MVASLVILSVTKDLVELCWVEILHYVQNDGREGKVCGTAVGMTGMYEVKILCKVNTY